VGPGSRVGLIGPNGCGKSTLLRVLVGDEPPDAGTILRADGLQVAYFAQHREALNPSLNVVDTLCPGGIMSLSAARAFTSAATWRASCFAASTPSWQWAQLSGGEQSRLAIARLMLRPANVLVLDEPTNDLDMDTLQVLEDSLLGFDGAVLLVTHDRYFLDRVTSKLLAFHTRPGAQGRISAMVGLAQWEAWYAEEAEATAGASIAGPKTFAADSAPAPRRKAQLH